MKINILVFVLFTFSFLLFTLPTFARTTPEDIINAKKTDFEKRLSTYSPLATQKLRTFDKKITDLNKKQTDELSDVMIRQGLILDEYERRSNDKVETTRLDVSKPIENARYWLTYAHEAVAYQAAKIYVFNLSSEKNVNSDIISTISTMQSDMNILRGKVSKSQNIIEKLVSEK